MPCHNFTTTYFTGAIKNNDAIHFEHELVTLNEIKNMTKICRY